MLAELPKSVEDLAHTGLKDLLDKDLLDLGVFLPRKDALNEVYDLKIGLDKWVEKT